MSKLAKRAIDLPEKVEVLFEKDKLKIKGAKGELFLNLKRGINVKIEKDKIYIEKDKKITLAKPFLGLSWSLLKNAIQGVSKGFEKRLLLVGVGFRAQIKGKKLDLQVGCSHPTELDIPEGIEVKIEKATEIILNGIDKMKLGLFAAKIRKIKVPEPYKGKGIRYKEEYVRKKAGKAAKGKGATA
ncbi:MAG: 50S ribosomal protein L6 [Chlamydiae bacterium SM23_39]|nr:MAG: 50S ribosomal protein L6 [Chlamydiae bacterium SM23_39]